MMIDHDDTWDAWLTAHGPRLVLYARQWAATADDAEDIVHDGFVRFWRSRDRVDARLPYLYRCVRSVALNRRRGETRRVDCAHLGADPSFVEPPGAAERRESVERALAGLPPAQREVVVLRVWGGLTFPEIGEAVGVSENTAASRYRLALAAMAGPLGAALDPEVKR